MKRDTRATQRTPVHRLNDAISPPAEMLEIAAAIPGSRFVEISAAGHMAPMEGAQAVNESIREFVEKVIEA